MSDEGRAVDREVLGQLPTLQDCVHCGLCLPACPTYELTGKEVQSPRGRIAALRLLGEGRSGLTPALADGLDDCLVCRSCESHCPSGISMEQLIAGFRHSAPRRGTGARLERLALRHVIPHSFRMRLATRATSWFAPILRRLPLARWRLPADIPRAARLRSRRTSLPLTMPATAAPGTPTRGKVALLRGCVTSIWFREELLATARVLNHNGYAVEMVGPSCCGALHKHAGLLEDSQRLGAETARQLDAVAPDHVVMESAGCAPALAELHGAATEAQRRIAPLVIDPFTLLAQHDWRPPRQRLAEQWVVAPPCHHQHGPLSVDGMREILEQTLEGGYHELPAPDHCCGAAGFYMVRNAQQSGRIGTAAKARFDLAPASGLLTGNPGCLLRWEALLPADVRVQHPIMALDTAYREGGDYGSS